MLVPIKRSVAGGLGREGLRVVPPPVEPLLSVREVAKLLGVSTATVYKLVEEGEIPHRRVRNSIRVRRGDLPG